MNQPPTSRDSSQRGLNGNSSDNSQNNNNTTRETSNIYIWIILLIIMGLLVCIFLKDSNSSYSPISYNETRQQNVDLSNEDESSDLPLEKNINSLSSNIISSSGFYDRLEGKSLEQSVSLLRNKAQEAKRIIPYFPDFPDLWLMPPVNKDSYGSIGERYCIEFLQLLFPGYVFKKVRPSWLRNPETGRPLELDGFCEGLMIAIEYNGIQHYKWPNFTGCTLEEFFKQRQRDQIKEEICIEKNICLIRIPYVIPVERIPLAVYSKLLDAVPGLN